MQRKSILAIFLVVVLATPIFPMILAADDGGTAEMGVEWITDWPGTDDDRANWYYSANYLYNDLLSRGWIGRFNWGNTNAWEKDFKPPYAPPDHGLMDSVDLGMIGTHGTTAYDAKWKQTLSAVYFSSNNDDWFLSPGEAYRYYGTNDLEWLIFDSCSVLRDNSMWYWHQTFNGLHLMLGFANTMYVVYPGDGGVFADRARYKGWWHPARTVTQAWFSAVSDQQPHGVLARVLAEELNNYNDYLWGEGYVSPDYPNDTAFWYWDHWSGTPDPLPLIGAAPTSLPVYQVVPRMVDQNYVKNIGMAFGLMDDTKIHQEGSKFYMVDVAAVPPTCQDTDTSQYMCDGSVVPSKFLEVNASGGFFFQKLDELWTKPEMTRMLPANDAAALSAANLFIRSNAKLLPGNWFSSGGSFALQGTPTIRLEGATSGPALGQALAAGPPDKQTNYAVDYGRSVAAAGQQLSIVGPGSRYNVYIGNNSAIVGFQGGWRDVVQPLLTNPGGQSLGATTVSIKTAAQAWNDFLANPDIALAKPPLGQYNTTGKPLPTLAYYEQASDVPQKELIPVWVFVADVYTTAAQALKQDPLGATQLVASDVYVYVPAASADTALPQASITSPAAGTKLLSGQSLNLTGTASGGTLPYTFQWSSSVDGTLGTGPTVAVPGGLHPDIHGGNAQPNTIYLLVSDADGKQATATVDVTVLLPVYLPLILR
jgi:hypothetical protein